MRYMADKVLLVLALCAGVALAAPVLSPGLEQAGAFPTDAGYYWWDSNDGDEWAPDYTWDYPQNAMGWLGDDTYWSTTLPFTIRFCGTLYSSGSPLYVGSNGLIGFAESGMDQDVNQDIPSATSPNSLIAVYWDNLNSYSNGEIYVDSRTNPDRLVITYDPWYFYGSAVDALEFQVVIFSQVVGGANNTIELRYKDVYGDSWRDAGLSATVGLENYNGASAAAYSFNQAVLEDDFAIRFADQDYVDGQLGVFHLLAPADGSHVDLGENVILDWEDSTYGGRGSISYRCYLADNPDFTSPVILDPGDVSQDSYIFGSGDEGTWYWKVKVTESILGMTRWSEETWTLDVGEGGAVVPASWGSIKADNR